MRKERKETIERAIEAYLLKECVKYGAVCVKVQMRRGFPDRLVYWFDGVHDLIELKRPIGGRFEPLQIPTHAKLRLRGHTVLVINTRSQVDEYIRSRHHAFYPALRSKDGTESKSRPSRRQRSALP